MPSPQVAEEELYVVNEGDASLYSGYKQIVIISTSQQGGGGGEEKGGENSLEFGSRTHHVHNDSSNSYKN